MRGGSVIGSIPGLLPGGGGSTPTPPLFRKKDWEVRPCSLQVAQRLTRDFHYSKGGANTATYTFGLYRRCVTGPRNGKVWGISWWIPPTKAAAEFSYPQNWRGVLALSRLVVLPEVPKNACSFLIRHSMNLINRAVWPCLLSFADEGQGHTGAIYKAAGWVESGWTSPEKGYRLNGRMVSRKAGPRTYTHQEMLKRGCICIGSTRKRRFVHLE